MDLTQDAIAHIQDTSRYNVTPLLQLGDGSGRTFLFDYQSGEYKQLARFVKQEGSVSTVESFAELVVEQAKRLARPTGSLMTVTFTSDGATFSPDDIHRHDLFTYRRVLSQQWQALVSVLAKPMSHKGLIRTLQSLSPSIVDFQRTFAAFQRLSISKDVKLTSEPVLGAAGSSDNSYHVNLSIKGAVAGETTLPSQISASLQYARGSSQTYEIPIEVDLTENDGTPVVTLFAPTMPALADQAVLDELALFDKSMELSGLSDLLSVVNF